MAIRVQILLDEEDREAFRAMAKREGQSLSGWFRQAGKEKMLSQERRKPIKTLKDLRRFFKSCDVQAQGKEPDWGDHLKVIKRSLASGQADT